MGCTGMSEDRYRKGYPASALINQDVVDMCHIWPGVALGMAIPPMLYYLERLAEPWLLAHAVVTPSYDICVPVGERRRGGIVSCHSREDAKVVWDMLRDWPNAFPAIAMRPFDSGACDLCWGFTAMPAYPPKLSRWKAHAEYERAMGEWLGYSQTAIERWLRLQFPEYAEAIRS